MTVDPQNLMRAPIGIFISTPEGRYVSVNPAQARMLGYESPEELVASVTDIATQIYVDSRERAEFARVLEAHGELVNFECRFRRRGGSIIWGSVNAFAVRDTDGKISHYQGFTSDITARKRAEEDLRRSEQKYRELINNINDVIFTVDLNGTITYLSPSAQTIFPDASALIGRNFLEIVDPQDLELVRRAWTDVLNNLLLANEYRLCLEPGKTIWVRTSSRPAYRDGVLVGVVGVLVDITERKQAGDYLKQVLDATNDGIWDYDLVSGKFGCSKRWVQMLGYESGEVDDFSCYCQHNIHPDDKALFSTAFMEYVEGRSSSYGLEFRLRAKNGEYIWIYSRGKALERDASGRALRMVGAHTDISAQKRIEASLRESEERFRLLAENLKEVLCLVEMGSNVLSYANPAFGKLFGMHADAFRRNPSLLAERIHPEDREAIRTLLNSQWGAEKLENQAMEYRLAMPDGEQKWVLSRVMYIRDASGNIARAAIMAEDITERKHAEKLIRDSARRLKYLSTKLLEAQEEERRNLAAELHDNIGPDLGTVKFGVENVINGLGNDCQDQKEVLQTVIGIVKKVVRLIGRLQMELRPSIIDDLGVIEALDWYCQDYMKVYRHVEVEKRVRTSENLIPERLKIVIYRIVQEAFNNVTKHSGANRISLCLESEADILTLVIEDNGQGFDPPATGNVKRRDSGLGLVSMRERAELSAGSFNSTSLPGSGTRIECQWDCEMVQGLEDNPA